MEAERPGASSRADRLGFGIAAGLALAAAIAVVVTRTGSHHVLLGDDATVDLRVRDVLSADTPLVGAYSRGFNHPGPVLFWVLAPLSLLAGGAAWATVVGGAALQGIAIAWSGWLAFRRGGLVLASLVLAAFALAYSALPLGVPYVMASNPDIAFPFFMLYLLQIWALSSGSRWNALAAVVTATFLVQLHIGYAPVVGAAAIWVAVRLVVDARRAGAARAGGAPAAAGEPGWWRVAGWSALALGVLWLAPVVEQLTHEPGNLTQIARNLGDGAAVGTRAAAGMFAAEFQPLPPWLGGHDALAFVTNTVEPASLAWLLVPAALLTVGFVAATRTGRVADRRMLELATVTAVATIVGIAQIRVDPVPFLFYWRIFAALFVVVAVVFAVIHWVDRRPRPTTVRVCWAIAVVAIAIATWPLVDGVIERRESSSATERSVRGFFEQIDALEATTDPVLVRGLGVTTNGIAQGVVDELDRAGAPVRVDPRYGFQYGDHRTARPSDVGEVWYVTQDGRYRSLLGDHEGARLVAYSSALSRADDAELVALQQSVAARLRAAGRPDLVDLLDSTVVGAALDAERVAVPGDEVARIEELNQKLARLGGCRCTLIAYPAAVAPDLPFTMGY